MTDMLLIAAIGLVVGVTAAALVFFFVMRLKAVPDPAEARMAVLAHQQSEAAARLEAMIGMLVNAQSQMQQHVHKRLDSVSQHLGESMEKTKQHTAENLQKLNERLAVIDSAQKNITDLASQVTSLQSVLTNKQQRGAFGQGRMEVIIKDGLPIGTYEFQPTLSNRTRPDCAIFLPDSRPLIIDAKFPLEAVTALRAAITEDDRKQAVQRVKIDVGKHVADIAGKYLIPGETQDLAFMFVPSESLYAELHEVFDDVVQKAHRARVMLVSPTLLMLAIQIVQQMQKDARMREAADLIRDEVGRMMEDLARLRERVLKLQQHFGQANEDVRQILVSADKIEKRAGNIEALEFDGDQPTAEIIVAPMPRKIGAAE